MKEARLLSTVAEHKVYNMIQLIHRARRYEVQSKDYDFSRLSMEEDWRAGCNDAVPTPRHPEVLQRPDTLDGWLVFGLIAFLSIGVFGAGCKSLEEDARDQNTIAPKDQSLLSKVDPSVTPPVWDQPPQLSKEYIYAGSRLLAVEDANANAAPPADLAIWRPSTGTWWVMGGQGSQQAVQGWGTNGDIPVPGDYDGDGKTDFSVFRPSTGAWYVINSSTGAWSVSTWGLSTDIPTPADYDGDGKTDTAVWRPSDGIWYIVRSSDQVIVYQQFGLSTDTTAPADGDGKADIGVWRSSDQTFYSINSGNNAFQQHYLGQSGERAVSADYDGDGKAD